MNALAVYKIKHYCSSLLLYFLEGKHKITATKKQNLLYFSGSYFSVKFTNIEFLHENCLHFFQKVTLCFRLK